MAFHYLLGGTKKHTCTLISGSIYFHRHVITMKYCSSHASNLESSFDRPVPTKWLNFPLPSRTCRQVVTTSNNLFIQPICCLDDLQITGWNNDNVFCCRSIHNRTDFRDFDMITSKDRGVFFLKKFFSQNRSEKQKMILVVTMMSVRFLKSVKDLKEWPSIIEINDGLNDEWNLAITRFSSNLRLWKDQET